MASIQVQTRASLLLLALFSGSVAAAPVSMLTLTAFTDSRSKPSEATFALSGQVGSNSYAIGSASANASAVTRPVPIAEANLAGASYYGEAQANMRYPFELTGFPDSWVLLYVGGAFSVATSNLGSPIRQDYATNSTVIVRVQGLGAASYVAMQANSQSITQRSGSALGVRTERLVSIESYDPTSYLYPLEQFLPPANWSSAAVAGGSSVRVEGSNLDILAATDPVASGELIGSFTFAYYLQTDHAGRAFGEVFMAAMVGVSNEGSIVGRAFVDPILTIAPEYLALDPTASVKVLFGFGNGNSTGGGGTPGGGGNGGQAPAPASLWLAMVGLFLLARLPIWRNQYHASKSSFSNRLKTGARYTGPARPTLARETKPIRQT